MISFTLGFDQAPVNLFSLIKRLVITVTDTTIFHNPLCSKSRATLALLEDEGIDFKFNLVNPALEQALHVLADQ